MKDTAAVSMSLAALTLALCLGQASCGGPKNSNTTPQASSTPSPVQSQTPGASPGQSPAQQSDVENQRRQAEQQTRPNIERQRRSAEQQAQSSLDADAVAVIAETRNALAAIAANQPDQALSAIERATGKVNVLLARNPAAAIIPVSFEVELIDTAPDDIKEIQNISRAAEAACSAKDYPTARVLLEGLTSEIRTRTYNLPLARYPIALTEAARLLGQQKMQEAAAVLLTALNTLVIVDRVTPLPLVAAQEAVDAAQAIKDKDKDAASKLLDMAKLELQRGRELGYYSASEPQFTALNQAITDLQTQMKGGGDTTSVFSALKEKLAAFFKGLTEKTRRGGG
jgi:outer membrane protein OmpA-like peptidoglycan-associated protein